MTDWQDLDIDRTQLNPEFEGFRLSLEKLPQYVQNLDNDVLVNPMSKNMFSLDQIRLFSISNHLFSDRFNTNLLFLICEDHLVYSVHDNMQEVQNWSPVLVHEEPEIWKSMQQIGNLDDACYQPSLSFPSEEHALMSDGRGTLVVFHTGSRLHQVPWKPLAMVKRSLNHVLYDSYNMKRENDFVLHFLTGQVSQDAKTKKHQVLIHSSSLSIGKSIEIPANGMQDFCVETSNVEYVSSDQEKIFVVSSKTKFTSASLPLLAPFFVWTQDSCSVRVSLLLTAGVLQADIEFSSDDQSLCVSVKGVHKIKGTFYKPVNSALSTWQFVDNRLELTFSKQSQADWPRFIDGEICFIDKCTVMDLDDSETNGAGDANMEETVTAEGTNDFPMLNQELEVCDISGSDDPLYLCGLVKGKTDPVFVVNLTGHHWLFESPARYENPKSFCVRHDVDGLLYTLTQNPAKPTFHTATFNALGYIMASKMKRRFVSCAPDYSYAAIADCERHVYLYWQPQSLQTELKNRKTGRRVANTSKQQILEINDTILGLRTLNHSIFVLTKSHLYKFKIEK